MVQFVGGRSRQWGAVITMWLASGCSAGHSAGPSAEPTVNSATNAATPVASVALVDSAGASAPTELPSAQPLPTPKGAPKQVDLDAVKPEGPEPAWKAVLVWTVNGEGDSLYSITTTWFEPGAGGTATEIAHRDEAVVATHNGLRALRGHPGTVKLCASDTCDLKTHKGCTEEARADERLDIVELTTGKKTPYPGQPDVPDPKYQGCKAQLSGFERHPSLSLIGSFVSIAEWDVDIRQGGLEWADFANTVNLDTNTADPLTLGKKDVDRLTKKGFTALIATDEERPCKVDRTDTPTRVENKFEFNRLGALIGVYGFRVRNAQACQGPSPYATTEDVRDPVIPAAIKDWKRLPSWLVNSATGDKVLGVSPIPEGQDLTALRKAFTTPIPGAKKPTPKTPHPPAKSGPKNNSPMKP
jgi:hypothetical protein